jgi:hypothetical protein
MIVVLFLHILVETIIGLLLLFYPDAMEIIPGFGQGEGASYQMLLKMYGLSALFLAAIGVVILVIRREQTQVAFLLAALLSGFHLLMAGVQFSHNPDTRAMLLHFLLCIFLGGIYARRKELIESESL